ncbi:MAG: hypothetical protein IJ468_06870 [Lachnospiraceae bacterium]|nr:hypothetical protein [Lachnospiraceae bacterium]
MMKRVKQMTVLIAMSIFLGSCGGESKEEIEQVISEFEYACDELDFNVLLECIDPIVADPLDLALTMSSWATDYDKEEVIEEILKKAFQMEEISFTEGFVSIEPTKIKVSGKYAEAKCELVLEKSGNAFDADIMLDFIRDDGQWYISGVRYAE